MNVKEVFSWGMYDLANTIFSALFVTFFFPFFVKQFLGGTEFQIGLVFGLSMLAVGLTVPFIGAWSDHVGRRMPFILIFTVICCALTYAVGLVPLYAALWFGGLANYAYHAALTTYNALLPKIAKPNELGNVSGIGTAMGYLGTLIGLGVAAMFLSQLGWETEAGAKAVFTITAVLFFVFSLFLFFGVKEKANKTSTHTALKEAYYKMKPFLYFIIFSFSLILLISIISVLLATILEKIIVQFTDVNKYVEWSINILCVLIAIKIVSPLFKKVVNKVGNKIMPKKFFYFLIAMFCFANAINAVILFLFLFAREEISLTVQMFFIVYVIQSFGAVVGSFVSGKLTDRFGAKRVLVWAGFGWIGVILMLYFVKNVEMFVVAGTLGGAFLGMWTTAQRPKLVEMVSKSTVGQFFGYLELTNKFSGVLGPIVFGALASFVSYGWAMLSLIVFFAVGLFTLRFVPGDGK